MAAYITPLGEYYEGDRAHALDTEVPQRPDHRATWDGEQWQLDPGKIEREEAQEKIERLERTEGQGVYVRGIREFMLGIADGLATINPQLSQQMLATPGMRKVKELNDKITELRKQL